MNKNIKIDINTASKDELSGIKGLGPALAQRIIDNRPYSDLAELTKVMGIGSNSIETIKSNLMVETSETSADFDAFVESIQDKDLDSESETIDEAVSVETIEEDQVEQFDTNFEDDSEEPILEGQVEQFNSNFEDVSEEPIVEDQVEQYETNFEDIEDSEAESEIFDANVKILEKEIDLEEQPLHNGEFENNPDKVDVPEPMVANFVEEKSPPAEDWITRSQLIWSLVGTAIFSIILTALITLGILSATNDGLRYATINDASRLENKITLLEDLTTTMKNDIQGLRTRLDALETVAGRVTTLEGRADGVDGEIEIIQTSITDISDTLGTVQEEIEVLKESAAKSTEFRSRLLDLLLEIEGQTEEGK
jgi:competence ComEA-like helix-hairpin-helix protein